MAIKRETSLTIKLSAQEFAMIDDHANAWNMTNSELLRKCIAIAMPIMEDNPFVRRVLLEDSKLLSEPQ